MTALHVIDAFTDRPFGGNPAAVCLLDRPADESRTRLVAREMNLSEMAFLHPIAGGFSLLRGQAVIMSRVELMP
jgi:predicted PhzF superfamily epimerase YddE/YHI9